jgi:hypothetical protein
MICSHVGPRYLLDSERFHRRVFADKQSSYVSSIRLRQPSNAQYVSVFEGYITSSYAARNVRD